MGKTILTLVILFVGIASQSCNAQPRSDYEIVTTSAPNIAKYHFFLEKKPASGNYLLTQDMDYLNPDVTALKIGQSTQPNFTINLANDGSEYKVGVVLEDTAGYYSGMATVIGNVGNAPTTPATIIFRKKN